MLHIIYKFVVFIILHNFNNINIIKLINNMEHTQTIHKTLITQIYFNVYQDAYI